MKKNHQKNIWQDDFFKSLKKYNRQGRMESDPTREYWHSFWTTILEGKQFYNLKFYSWE